MPSDLVFPIRVVVDPDCLLCTPKHLGLLRHLYPNAKVVIVEAKSKEGKAIIERLGATRLPIYLLGKEVEQAPSFSYLRSYVVESDGEYMMRPDVVMHEVHLARPRTLRHLDLFVAALAPDSVKAALEVLRFFQETKPNDMTLSLHMLVQEAAPADAAPSPGAHESGAVRAAAASEVQASTSGPLLAPGGDAELTEGRRQLCLFQHASLGDLFTYLGCRSQAQDAAQANACLVLGPAVQQCVDGPEGEQLLRRDAQLVRDLGVMRGPAMLWENRYGPFQFYEVDSLGRLTRKSGR